MIHIYYLKILLGSFETNRRNMLKAGAKQMKKQVIDNKSVIAARQVTI